MNLILDHLGLILSMLCPWLKSDFIPSVEKEKHIPSCKNVVRA
jgi:hypothetical protein